LLTLAAASQLTIAADKPTADQSAASQESSRRTVNKPIIDQPAFSSAQANAKTDSAKKERNPRILFITAKNSPQCDKELARLNAPGGDFEKLRAIGWTIGEGPENMVQIVDRDDVTVLLKKMNLKEFPTVASVDKTEVVRYFRSGCTTPLDMWTIGFLLKGVDERPMGMVSEAARVESTGSYPLRGNHWSVEGDWDPTREKVIEHLHGPNHQSELQGQWKIENWSLEELRSLHDDLHERYDTGTLSNYRSSTMSGPSYLHAKGS
jgi:hypothetical protein